MEGRSRRFKCGPFSGGVDRIIFSPNRLFIAARGVAKVMVLRPFKFASVPFKLQIFYKYVMAMWYISEKHCMRPICLSKQAGFIRYLRILPPNSRPESRVGSAVRAINLPDYDGLSPSLGECLVAKLPDGQLSIRWRVAAYGLNAAFFRNGMDRIIFSCNRLFIAGGVAKVMDLALSNLRLCHSLTLQIIYKRVSVLWRPTSVSDQLFNRNKIAKRILPHPALPYLSEICLSKQE
ncbi:hypothetical protein CEXT_782451 [Caerostris extrusa]|uniref:Uncharacterized protein n=1 Tax=Caerostris extrusa TaxID=172846 RepID=A0AAV4MG00_CAEEX|nr:hypothetical protein CEXT_782451 [Caerostris extrusa]